MATIRKSAPINLIVYYPKTEEGKLELAQRVAEVHANAVHRHIQSLHSSTAQKLRLLDAVIEDARKQANMAGATEESDKKSRRDRLDR